METLEILSKEGLKPFSVTLRLTPMFDVVLNYSFGIVYFNAYQLACWWCLLLWIAHRFCGLTPFMHYVGSLRSSDLSNIFGFQMM